MPRVGFLGRPDSTRELAHGVLSRARLQATLFVCLPKETTVDFHIRMMPTEGMLKV
jgi:hypothetical protein